MKTSIFGAVALLLGSAACNPGNNSVENEAATELPVPTTAATLPVATAPPATVPRPPLSDVPLTHRPGRPSPVKQPKRVNRGAVRNRPPRAKPPFVPAPGWDEVKDRIAACESGGRYEARNPRSTASGKYQFLDSTWAGRYGLKRAYLATPEQQEQAAAELHAARGLQPWKASQHCWNRKP